MNLTDIFKKPLDRPIDGVIKADDFESLKIEVDEYVLTKEIEKRLEEFLDAYNNYEGANGVWISGFFGSGKSHLLKMLALILENHQLDGVSLLESFLPKCSDSEFLSAELKKACSIPSKSILFNIDQKASIISKKDVDALLAVFVKVFDEMCGYFGKQPHIAQFERDLDKRGLYDQFKEKYKSISNLDWEKGREETMFESDNIAKAYAEVTNNSIESGKGIIDKYRSDYKLSIEDFADQINVYIDSKGSNFRLNFFVDEVGQYIADNTKLMTNLQTVAESLATKCRGRAWIIVTAQEDMSTVIGEDGKQQSNDFSKIQARFSNRLKLTSQDVAEVIQKRLLAKNSVGFEEVSNLYHREHNNFKTLFDFTDGSRSFKNYRDKEHFSDAYPFVPYQFPLFQSAIQNLSIQNAFEGKHSSVGERSMLGVFREVAINISNKSIGQLATFDLMYEGIFKALKANTQRDILTAQQHLGNEFATRVLKALFLVKYVKGFKSTLRNICILMLDSFDTKIDDLKYKVTKALELLQRESYIQVNGDVYEFLTDTERDIEKEIKAVEVENNDVLDEISELVFVNILKSKKIKYEDNNQDYNYSRKVDNILKSRENELSINIITPAYEFAGNIDVIKSHCLSKPELTIIINENSKIYREVTVYKQTEKYIRQNQGLSQQNNVAKIIHEKANINRNRSEDLKKLILDDISKAEFLILGETLELQGEDPLNKISKAFSQLITRVYPSLRLLNGKTFKEADVDNYLNESGETLFGNDAITMSESEMEILSTITNNNIQGVRTTVKALIDKFDKKPYGWYYSAIICTLARLISRGKVEVRQDSVVLEDEALSKAIKNSSLHNNLVLQPQVEFSNAQVRALQEFHDEFFDTKTNNKDPKTLGKEVSNNLDNLISELKEKSYQSSNFPFVEALNPVIETLSKYTNKSYTYYLTEFLGHEDELFDLKENYIDPMTSFMNSSSLQIYKDASLFVQTNKTNFNYIENFNADDLTNILSDNLVFKGSKIKDLKTTLDHLKVRVENTILETKNSIINKLQSLKSSIEEMEEYKSLSDTNKATIIGRFNNFESTIRDELQIPVLNDSIRRFEDTEYTSIMNQVIDLSRPEVESSEESITPSTPVITSVRDLNIGISKSLLDSIEDVDDYIEALKNKLVKEIENGRRVRI